MRKTVTTTAPELVSCTPKQTATAAMRINRARILKVNQWRFGFLAMPSFCHRFPRSALTVWC